MLLRFRVWGVRLSDAVRVYGLGVLGFLVLLSVF